MFLRYTCTEIVKQLRNQNGVRAIHKSVADIEQSITQSDDPRILMICVPHIRSVMVISSNPETKILNLAIKLIRTMKGG